jgi:hypothetical protein
MNGDEIGRPGPNTGKRAPAEAGKSVNEYIYLIKRIASGSFRQKY